MSFQLSNRISGVLSADGTVLQVLFSPWQVTLTRGTYFTCTLQYLPQELVIVGKLYALPVPDSRAFTSPCARYYPLPAARMDVCICLLLVGHHVVCCLTRFLSPLTFRKYGPVLGHYLHHMCTPCPVCCIAILRCMWFNIVKMS